MRQDELHASESAAVASPHATSLAALLTGHVLRDGEVVLLVLKPSLWFILFQSIRFAAVVVLLLLLARAFGDHLPLVHRVAYIEAGVFLIAGRLMGAVLQWMARLVPIIGRYGDDNHGDFRRLTGGLWVSGFASYLRSHSFT